MVFDEIGNFMVPVKLPGNPKAITVGQTALFYKNNEEKPVVFSLTTGQVTPFDAPENAIFDAFIQTPNYSIIVGKEQVRILKK